MKLAVFMTYGMSLARWEEAGILDREILLYRELAKNFEEIHLFSYGGKEENEYKRYFPDKVMIHTSGRRIAPAWYQFWMLWKHRRILREVDFVRTNQMKGALTAVLAGKLWKAKLVVRCGFEWLNLAERKGYKWWKRMIINWLERIAYEAAAAIIITSEGEGEYIKKRFPFAAEKIRVVPNYVDTEKFRPSTQSPERAMIYIGRLSKEKNLANFIKSLAGLDVELAIVGDGPERHQLEKIAQETGIVVKFSGRKPSRELPVILERHRFFVLPSFHEGNPKALLEAMSMERVCVGTRVVGIENVITDGVDGFLSGVTSEELREVLKKTLKMEEVDLNRIGERARETIINNYSLEVIINKELKIYEALR